jgi:hypothetical protein
MIHSEGPDHLWPVVVVPTGRETRHPQRFYLETWRAHHPGLELELLD